jgi:hypothetical protein
LLARDDSKNLDVKHEQVRLIHASIPMNWAVTFSSSRFRRAIRNPILVRFGDLIQALRSDESIRTVGVKGIVSLGITRRVVLVRSRL